ncbi:MAG TPA: RDD family protein [Gammaproteobacteria bacterium]|nr:RDD family protein [Gammaproteobacteria bacterium]
MSAQHIPEPASHPAPLTSPGLFRRLASGLYDAIILLAIWILGTFLIMPFTHGVAFESFYSHHAGMKLLYQLGLLAMGFAFFSGFWTHGGQTIGMRAWKLRTVCMDGAPLGWRQALIRYLTMLIPWLLVLLGCEFLINSSGQAYTNIYSISAIGVFLLSIAAFAWPAFDRNRFAWHDHLSGTRLVVVRAPLTQEPA